jgi:hypothetical protein
MVIWELTGIHFFPFAVSPRAIFSFSIDATVRHQVLVKPVIIVSCDSEIKVIIPWYVPSVADCAEQRPACEKRINLKFFHFRCKRRYNPYAVMLILAYFTGRRKECCGVGVPEQIHELSFVNLQQRLLFVRVQLPVATHEVLSITPSAEYVREDAEVLNSDFLQ